MKYRFPVVYFPVIAFLWLIVGCDLLRMERPEEARMRLEGNAGDSLEIVTSTRFLSQRQVVTNQGVPIGDTLNVLLLDADTMFVVLPFEQIFDIQETERFYAYILRLNPEGDELYSRIWIDEDLRSEKRPRVEENSLLFIYDFRIANGEDPDDTF